MSNTCENLKQEYESLQRLVDEYNVVYLRVRDSGDFIEAKQLKKELKQKRDTLKEKLLLAQWNRLVLAFSGKKREV
ncbi:MAG: hypothetical protein HYW78_02010 [Parcubacteria group bacterium]|nr:hypothetical protein [Parcubacteria group bacterium]